MITLRKALAKDCRILHHMQVESFRSLLEKYQDYHSSPGARTLKQIEEKMALDAVDYYLVLLENKPVGGICILREGAGTCCLSQIFLLPRYQGNGYAQTAILLAEQQYPQAKRWKLDTVQQEKKLCHLYEKLGYRLTGGVHPLQDGMTLVDYAKEL